MPQAQLLNRWLVGVVLHGCASGRLQASCSSMVVIHAILELPSIRPLQPHLGIRDRLAQPARNLIAFILESRFLGFATATPHQHYDPDFGNGET